MKDFSGLSPCRGKESFICPQWREEKRISLLQAGVRAISSRPGKRAKRAMDRCLSLPTQG